MSKRSIPVPTVQWSRDMHRIVCAGLEGQWTPYRGIASLKVGDVVYRHASDYYYGDLPTGVVFTVQEVTK